MVWFCVAEDCVRSCDSRSNSLFVRPRQRPTAWLKAPALVAAAEVAAVAAGDTLPTLPDLNAAAEAAGGGEMAVFSEAVFFAWFMKRCRRASEAAILGTPCFVSPARVRRGANDTEGILLAVLIRSLKNTCSLPFTLSEKATFPSLSVSTALSRSSEPSSAQPAPSSASRSSNSRGGMAAPRRHASRS